MLDVSRHFSNKDEIKHLLDLMALHKLNTFHWHLVDDQGCGSKLKNIRVYDGNWRLAKKKTLASNSIQKTPLLTALTGRYGGFTRRRMFVRSLPMPRRGTLPLCRKLKLPGHSTAALAAYPQFSCTGGPLQHRHRRGRSQRPSIARARHESFTFVQDVLTEVFALFPANTSILAATKCRSITGKPALSARPACSRKGLQNEHELQGYFIRRIEKFINANGRNLIGWSEIREGSLAQNTAVMDWIGGAVAAASAGHDVVMSPMSNCYFDHYQSQDHSTEPPTPSVAICRWTRCTPSSPIPMNLPAKYRIHILGRASQPLDRIHSLHWPGGIHGLSPPLGHGRGQSGRPNHPANWDDFMLRNANSNPALRSTRGKLPSPIPPSKLHIESALPALIPYEAVSQLECSLKNDERKTPHAGAT